MEHLSESHKRALNTLALVTEQKLLDIELTFIKPGFHRPIHFSFDNDLSLEKKDAMRQLMQQLRGTLVDFGNIYAVKNETSSIQREVHTKTTFLWEMLCEYTGNRLDHYGPMDEVTKKDVEARVEKMIELVLKMEHECK